MGSDAPSLIDELKRRRVFRALVGYGAVAFALLQIIEPIMHGLHWPDAVLTYVVAALAIGFPIVVGLAWIFDVNAGRVERTEPVPAFRGVRLGLLLAGIGVLAAAPGIAWFFLLRRPAVPATAASTGATGPSIAVLPFLNLSSDKEQDYFSDGITEEILNALAQLDGLRVIGRTSSFAMKGKNEDLRSIGAQLGAGHLLEGSVRKAGARVRITAQLIEAAGGSHLWSQQFDRELTDVFAVQEEIARAVVVALKLKLLPNSQSVSLRRPASSDAYEQYLLGRHFLNRQERASLVLAVDAFQKSVAIDPGYAPAWAGLANASDQLSDFEALLPEIERRRARAEEAAERAVVRGPELADGFAVRGQLRSVYQWNWDGARTDLERALQINPGDAETQRRYGGLLASLGQVPEGIASARKATVLDPLAASAWTTLGLLLTATGRYDEARAALRRAWEIAPDQPYAPRNLGYTYLLQGRFQDASATFDRIAAVNHVTRTVGAAFAEHELHHEDRAQAAIAELTDKHSRQNAYQLAQIHAWQGRRELAFVWLDKAFAAHDAGLSYLKFDPFLKSLRTDARYTALLQRMKLPAE